MTINEVLIKYGNGGAAGACNTQAEALNFNYSPIQKKLNSKYDSLARILYPLFRITNGLKVNGLDNLAELKGSPYVIISNHKSSLDPIYINSSLRDYARVRWISKSENFKKGLYSSMMEIGQVIPLSKERKMTPLANYRVKEVFGLKEALGIFPEGTRNQSGDGKLLEFHTGAAKICIENNVPYVPIAIIGNAKPFKGKVTINIGRPVHLKSIQADYEDYKIMAFDMKDQLDQLILGNFDFFPATFEA